jgi:hypothetical protein
MRAALVALAYALALPALARADLPDTLWTWRGAPETKTAELRLFEVGRDTVGARVRVRYKALALGLPAGARLTAWSFPVGVSHGLCLQTGFAVDSAGRVDCASQRSAADTCARCTLPLDQIVLSATAYLTAEPYRLGLVSDDAATAVYAEAFPYPLETHTDSLSLHLELARADGKQFAVVGEGYPPGAEVGVTIRSDDRSTGYKMKVPAEGRFRIVVYPQVADKRTGFASITVEHAKRKLTLDWPWGEGALKAP